MPTPNKGESKSDFIERCVPAVIKEGYPKDQAVAICYSIWKREKKENSFFEQRSEYNLGIYQSDDSSSLICDDKKVLILKNNNDESICNIPLLLYGDQYAYGYIELNRPYPINNWNEYSYYKEQHQFTTNDWIENGWKFPLFAYPIIKYDLFNLPKGIIYPKELKEYLVDAERYINESGDVQIEERIIGDEDGR